MKVILVCDARPDFYKDRPHPAGDAESFKILGGRSKESTHIELWDGEAAERIVAIISRGGSWNEKADPSRT